MSGFDGCGAKRGHRLAILVIYSRSRGTIAVDDVTQDEGLRSLQTSILTIVLHPLLAAIVAGLGNRMLGNFASSHNCGPVHRLRLELANLPRLHQWQTATAVP
jgi:hypothetical protein